MFSTPLRFLGIASLVFSAICGCASPPSGPGMGGHAKGANKDDLPGTGTYYPPPSTTSGDTPIDGDTVVVGGLNCNICHMPTAQFQRKLQEGALAARTARAADATGLASLNSIERFGGIAMVTSRTRAANSQERGAIGKIKEWLAAPNASIENDKYEQAAARSFDKEDG